MQNNSRGFISILLLVTLVTLSVIGISYYTYKNGQAKLNSSTKPLISSTLSVIPEETTNWKTYSNFTYTIKYPPNFDFNENNPISGINQLISPIIPEINSNFRITFKPYINKYGTLEKIAKSAIECGSISSQKGDIYRVGGKEALIFKDTLCGQYGNTYIVVSNNNIFIEITIESHSSYSAIQTLVDETLSTFQFIENGCKEGDVYCCPKGWLCD